MSNTCDPFYAWSFDEAGCERARRRVVHKGPRAKTNRRSTRPTKKRAKDDVITFQAWMAGELEDDEMEEVVEKERE